MSCLQEEALAWVDSEEYALALRDRFWAELAAHPSLATHRSFCGYGYGMGEDAFHWMWKLLVDELPDGFRFLEVGVYKGQVPSLVRLLADETYKGADIFGVTLLSPFAGLTGKFCPHPDDNYMRDIKDLHDHFDQPMPVLIVGDSTSWDVHEIVGGMPPFDVVFIDACHEYDFVAADLLFYPKLVKEGGYLVIDDAACDLKQPFGFFQGIQDVCKAARTVILTDPQWEHVITVCHDRIFRRNLL